LLLEVATLGPITRFVTFWVRCAKRRHQEAMIYLAYERDYQGRNRQNAYRG
jgi:hypothetical protein